MGKLNDCRLQRTAADTITHNDNIRMANDHNQSSVLTVLLKLLHRQIFLMKNANYIIYQLLVGTKSANLNHIPVQIK